MYFLTHVNSIFYGYTAALGEFLPAINEAVGRIRLSLQETGILHAYN